MKFEYHLVVAAPHDRVWKILEDIPRAAQLMPGVDSVEPFEECSYKCTLRIRIGPMGFNLSGVIGVDTDRGSGTWTIKAQAQDTRIGGGVLSTMETAIIASSTGTTEINIKADVQFSGRLGQLGQPLIKKKADSMVREFTENLENAVMGVR